MFEWYVLQVTMRIVQQIELHQSGVELSGLTENPWNKLNERKFDNVIWKFEIWYAMHIDFYSKQFLRYLEKSKQLSLFLSVIRI